MIDESLAIMHWASAQNDRWTLAGGDEIKAEWIDSRNDGEFKTCLDRYKYADRHDAGDGGLFPASSVRPGLCLERMEEPA